MEPKLEDAKGNVIDVSNAEMGRQDINSLYANTINVKTIKGEVEKALEGKDPELQVVVLKHVNSMDADGDSRIDPTEISKFVIACAEDGIEAGKKIRWLVYCLLLAVPLVVLMALSTFGATTASVYMAKDTFVEAGGTALVTEDDEPVSVNENSVDLPVAALAFVPDAVCDKVSRVVLRGQEGQVYHKKVDSIVVVPEKSVVMETTKGDVVSWNSSSDGGGGPAVVEIALSDGKSWSIPSACGSCSATSVVADDDVAEAVEIFRETFGCLLDNFPVDADGVRRLQGPARRLCPDCGD